ncbi:unnamed protein product [Cyprideis torosa]|uniref:Uncharacterized protein n=1 Tax=Cyprideis torosa TaxID=163714 RepID=A0A7R8WJR5_9CRUS|nr:unnamed protein product [Cyprideis torosa]CAG0895292.1 unnamed protein product [Cyprideis torosa]
MVSTALNESRLDKYATTVNGAVATLGHVPMVNLTSDILTSPVSHMLLGSFSGPMSLEKDIGLNFLKTSGNWTSNIFLNYQQRQTWSYNLCYTMHDPHEYYQQDYLDISFEADPDMNITWNIYLTPGVDILSEAILWQVSLSTKFIALEPGNLAVVTFHIEENIILSTDDMPCNSNTSYRYSKCMDDCAKEQFLTSEMYDRENFTRCQIPGFQNVTELEPCRDLEQTRDVLWEYANAALREGQRESCAEKCPSSCNQLDYKYSVKRDDEYEDSRLAYFTLWNQQEFRTVTTQQWSYGGLEMAADVGGYVGALLGISLLSVSYKIIQRVRRMLQKQEQKWITEAK